MGFETRKTSAKYVLILINKSLHTILHFRFLGILNKDSGLTAVSWNPSLENILAIGNEDGEVIIMDARKLGTEALRKSNAFCRPIHKLLFNPCSGRYVMN